ncbi:hypothetical protein FZW96_15105 [Bacillus sp. BGMRC 2118]|nr:hypothetical protein FZW96_15105 [Bacillus sp. BGMRC 2118]
MKECTGHSSTTITISITIKHVFIAETKTIDTTNTNMIAIEGLRASVIILSRFATISFNCD